MKCRKEHMVHKQCYIYDETNKCYKIEYDNKTNKYKAKAWCFNGCNAFLIQKSI